MRLTQATYTDASVLPLFDEITKIPTPSLPQSPHGRPQKSVQIQEIPGKFAAAKRPQPPKNVVAIREERAPLGKAVPGYEGSELAERVGFEPTVPFGTPDFESGTIDHSVTSPQAGR